MKNAPSVALLALTGFYIMLWIGGVVSINVWDTPPEGTEWAAPTFLYVASLLVLIRVSRRARIMLAAVGIFGFGAEVLGESTGFPFGQYHYTDRLGPALFDVPLALFSAWIVVSAFVVNVLLRLRLAKRWWLLTAPLTMVVVDLLLEPVAVGPMEAWAWDGDGVYYGVPAVNFLGWFLVSIPIYALLVVADYQERRGFVASSSVIVFFIVISAFSQLWWPVAIAALALAALGVARATSQLGINAGSNSSRTERA